MNQTPTCIKINMPVQSPLNNPHNLDRDLFKAVTNENLHEAKKLLKQGANPNLLLKEGVTAFHVAVGVKSDLKFTKLCINYGADVNVRSCDNWTPLHVAACWNKVDSMNLLLDNDANPDLVTSQGQSPLQLAIEFNNHNCIQALRSFKIKLLNKRAQMEQQYHNRAHFDTTINIENDEQTYDLNNQSECSATSNTLVRSSTMNDDNHTLEETSKWIDDASHQNENTTFIQNKIENIEDNETYKQILFQKKKLNETLLNKTPDKSCMKPTTNRSSAGNIDLKDLEVMISNIIDKKLKDTSATALESTTTFTDISKNDSNLQHQKTPVAKQQAQSPPPPPKPLNLKQNLKTPSPPVNDTDSVHSGKSNIYSKFKNWFNKVNGSASPPGTGTDARSTNTGITCNNTGLAGFCLGSKIHNVNSDFSVNENQKPPDRGTPTEKQVQSMPMQRKFTPTVHKDQPPAQIKSLASSSCDSIGSSNAQKKPTTPVRTKTPHKQKAVLFDDLEERLKDIDRRTREFIDEENKKFSKLINMEDAKKPSQQQSPKVQFEPQPHIIQHEKLYQVDEDIYLKETTLLTSDNSTIYNNNYEDPSMYYSAIYSWDAYDPDKINEIVDRTVKKSDTVPNEIKNLTDMELRREIESYGDRPGPITKTTRGIYELRLFQLKMNGPKIAKLNNSFNENQKGFSMELIEALNGQVDFLNDSIEANMAMCFGVSNGNWREGHVKSCFNYLLIDPRVSDNLPARARFLDPIEVFRIFIASIFYVGKGTRSRPYAHLYDALKKWKNNEKPNSKPDSRKMKQIMNIWSDNCGVVSLHCFQNVIPCEAYTREASMIEALGLQHLTNLKKGDYYGVANAWTIKRKSILGVILLKKACDIFIAEGERQIRPVDI